MRTFVYICMYIYIFVYTCVYIYKYTYAHTLHIYMCICKYIYIPHSSLSSKYHELCHELYHLNITNSIPSRLTRVSTAGTSSPP